MLLKEIEENFILHSKNPEQEYDHKNKVSTLMGIVIFDRVNVF